MEYAGASLVDLVGVENLNDVTSAVADPLPSSRDTVDDHIRAPRRHIDKLRIASSATRNNAGAAEPALATPHLHLPETIEAMREACEKELRRA